MKRQRGRNNGRKPHIPVRSQTFDSSGPDVRIRGNAYQVLEKYLALARDATAAGDRVAAENFYQHAEHYYRLINANAEGQMRGQMQGHGGQHGHPQHGGHPQQYGGNQGGHPGHGYPPQQQPGNDPRAGGMHEPSPADPGAGPQPAINGPHGSGTGGDGQTS